MRINRYLFVPTTIAICTLAGARAYEYLRIPSTKRTVAAAVGGEDVPAVPPQRSVPKRALRAELSPEPTPAVPSATSEPTAGLPNDDYTPPEARTPGLDLDGLTLLEEALRAEPRDTWAERQLREQLDQSLANLPGLSVRELDCSDSMCRVALTRGPHHGSAITTRLATMAPHGGIIITTNSKLAGEGNAIAFIAKVGSRLALAPR